MSTAELQRKLTEHIGSLFSDIEEAKRLLSMAASDAKKLAEPYVGKVEAAEFLDISVSTLERRMSLPDGPPRYTDGGKVSFLRSELRVWRRQWAAGDQTGLEETRGA